MFNNKQALYVSIVVSLAIIIGAISYFRMGEPKSEDKIRQESMNQSTVQAEKKPEQKEVKSQVWDGTLKASDNPARGNFMLVTSSNTVYIYTSRDYNELTGKKVNVTYEGSMDNFTLGDITEK